MIPAAQLKPDMSMVTDFVNVDRGLGLVRALMVLAVGLLVAAGARRGLSQVLTARLAPEQRKLVLTIVSYLLFGLTATWALREMGFEISVLLGAAGALTVGLSIASQTSASNLISGLFLVAEQPFHIGDVIEVAGFVGTVLSIDILSTKLKTLDNRFVRVPNETVLKSAVVNITRFDLRKQVIQVVLDQASPPAMASQVLTDLIAKQPAVVTDPKPLVLVAQLDAAALRLNLVLWSSRSQVDLVRSRLLTELPAALLAAGLRLPQPIWQQATAQVG